MRPKLFLRDHQCITVRQRMTRHPFVHYNALFFCTLSVIHCGNLYFLLLHSFHVAPFPCCTFLWSNIFMLHFFSCCTLFISWTISCCACNVFVFDSSLFHIALAMFSFCILLLFHSSHVASFSCCTLFILHYFQKCGHDPHRHGEWCAKMESAAKISILDAPKSHSYASAFSYCTFFMLHFLILKVIKNERMTENVTKKATLHSALWTYFTFTLITHLC